MFRTAQWGGFGVGLSRPLSSISGFQHAEALRIGSHNAVFDPVVDHFYKMSRTVGATVQIPLLGRSTHFFGTWRTRNTSHTGSKRGEDRIQALNDVCFTAD